MLLLDVILRCYVLWKRSSEGLDGAVTAESGQRVVQLTGRVDDELGQQQLRLIQADKRVEQRLAVGELLVVEVLLEVVDARDE